MKRKLLGALLMCLALNWHIKDTVHQKKSLQNKGSQATRHCKAHPSKKS